MDEALIKRMYDALNAAMALGDEAGIARLLGPVLTTDIELYPSAELLDSKPAHGIGEVVEWLASMSFSEVRWRLETLEERPDGVVLARGVVEGRGETSGANAIARFEHEATIRYGRVAKVVASITSNVG